MTALLVAALLLSPPQAEPLPPPRPPITSALPIYLTSYDPALGGINCSNPPHGCSHLGNGMAFTPDLYDRSAACVPSWAGYTVHVWTDAGEMRLPCNDSGGAIRVKWKDGVGLVIAVDVLSDKLYDPGPYDTWVLERWVPHAVQDRYVFTCIAIYSWGDVRRHNADENIRSRDYADAFGLRNFFRCDKPWEVPG